MSLSSCGKHNIIASKRCPVCHRPLCVNCKTHDQCCSKKCFKSRQKFAFQSTNVVQRPNNGFLETLITLIKLAALSAALFYGARYFGFL